MHGGGVVGVEQDLLVDAEQAVHLQLDTTPSGEGDVPGAVGAGAQQGADLDGDGGGGPPGFRQAAGEPVLGVDLRAGGVQQADQQAGLAGPRVAGVAGVQRGGPAVEVDAGE
nr:hypothetical protein GCM10020093_110000 [Planobispora longispora]